ncbi:Pecanex-like protein 1, partial [Dissostichus eleginoides]
TFTSQTRSEKPQDLDTPFSTSASPAIFPFRDLNYFVLVFRGPFVTLSLPQTSRYLLSCSSAAVVSLQGHMFLLTYSLPASNGSYFSSCGGDKWPRSKRSVRAAETRLIYDGVSLMNASHQFARDADSSPRS